jgi:O-antigen ligase
MAKLAKQWQPSLLRISLLVLPYQPIASLVGLVVLLITVFWQHGQAIAKLAISKVFLAISLLMILGCFFAYNKPESWLQLANYLPFFGLFIALRWLLTSPRQLEQIAADLVLTAIPLNLIGIVEFALKVLRKLPLSLPDGFQWQLFGWPGPEEPNRVVSLFIHPNFFAGYLILVFGLGLGLVLKISDPPVAQRPGLPPAPIAEPTWLMQRKWLIYFGTYLNLAGIFCAGSRNAIAAALLQLLIFSLLLKGRRTLKLIFLAGMLAIAAGVAVYGFGGRQANLQSFTSDPRVGVWQIALDLIRQRPWLGWGMGSFKFLYPPRLIDPTYPDIAHPHNFWLLMAAESGIPVMLALTAAIGYFYYRGVRVFISHQLEAAEQAILLGYLLAFGGSIAFALFDVTLFDARINVLNWLTLAGIALFVRRDNSKTHVTAASSAQ